MRATAPWSLGGHVPGAAVVYAVRRGCAFLRIDGDPAVVAVEAGDALVLPVGRPHVLGDGGGVPADLAALVAPRAAAEGPAVAVLGGHELGAPSELVAAVLGLEGVHERTLLSLLPPVLHVARAPGTTLDAALTLALEELGSPGLAAAPVVARLFDVVVMKVIERCLARVDASRLGWWRGADDGHIAAALLAMHERPGRPWTVAELARAVGMSRSVFAARFQGLVGTTPLAYLTALRVERASEAIRRGAGVAEAALAVGYRSEAAFARAFKRIRGESPGASRRRSAPAAREAVAPALHAAPR